MGSKGFKWTILNVQVTENPLYHSFLELCDLPFLPVCRKAIFEFRGYVKAEVTFRARRREQNVICLRRWGETAIFRHLSFISIKMMIEIAIVWHILAETAIV